MPRVPGASPHQDGNSTELVALTKLQIVLVELAPNALPTTLMVRLAPLKRSNASFRLVARSMNVMISFSRKKLKTKLYGRSYGRLKDVFDGSVASGLIHSALDLNWVSGPWPLCLRRTLAS